jgi:hypothetical protein
VKLNFIANLFFSKKKFKLGRPGAKENPSKIPFSTITKKSYKFFPNHYLERNKNIMKYSI